MSLLKGKQIQDTSIDLTKLSGTGSVALTDGADFTLPTGEKWTREKEEGQNNKQKRPFQLGVS